MVALGISEPLILTTIGHFEFYGLAPRAKFENVQNDENVEETCQRGRRAAKKKACQKIKNFNSHTFPRRFRHARFDQEFFTK